MDVNVWVEKANYSSWQETLRTYMLQDRARNNEATETRRSYEKEKAEP